MFYKAARMQGAPDILLSGLRYYSQDLASGSFAFGAPTNDRPGNDRTAGGDLRVDRAALCCAAERKAITRKLAGCVRPLHDDPVSQRLQSAKL